MTLLNQERAKYDAIWDVDAYRAFSPGKEYAPVFLTLLRPPSHASVLDAGCGQGAGTRVLLDAGLQVTGLDLVKVLDADLDVPFLQQPLWDRIPQGPFDYAYCCDVLEHIPPEFTMLTVSRLLDAARDVFLSISFVPDAYGVWVGEPLHQTVQSYVWWRDHLRMLGTLIESRDLLNAGVFWVRA